MFVLKNGTGSFGRRASDGGANLHIYYPASSNAVLPGDNLYSNQNSRECLRIVIDPNQQQCEIPVTMESADESNDEIQR